MRSINGFLPATGLRLLIVLALVSGSGCQFMAVSDKAATDAGTAEAAASETGAEAATRLPNPYLADPPAVSSAARQRFAAAREALDQQQWEVAETDLLWLTANYPDLSGPYLNLAMLYQQSGQDDKVEPAFRQAMAANPKNITAYNQYGIYLRGQGRFSDAEQAYLKALEVWPDSPQSHLNLGILYDLYMGKLQPALDQYRAYMELQDEPDRRVQGWIVDTERRLSQRAAESGGEP